MLYSPASLLVEPNEVLVLIGAYCRPFASALKCILCPLPCITGTETCIDFLGFSANLLP